MGTFADRLKPGPAAQSQALRDMFRDTFNPYRPAVIEWPRQSPEEQNRTASLPMRDIAVQTEGVVLDRRESGKVRKFRCPQEDSRHRLQEIIIAQWTIDPRNETPIDRSAGGRRAAGGQ